jgi:hypothetical protein
MRLLSKVWFRLVASLFGAGAIAEAVDLYTGAAFGPRPPVHPAHWLFFVLSHVVLTALLWLLRWRQAGRNLLAGNADQV